ncbi:MAG TPA: peptide ABC transporter substrate-binding protein [Dehalococcoidia bacterium]|nr:peptide ABC transporter substrate-binding protein [Dehalococcoidia bacterium]
MKLVFVLLSLLLLVAIACSSDSATDPTREPAEADFSRSPSSTALPGEASTPTPIAEPADVQGSTKAVDGGTFLRLGVDPPTLDPHLNTDASSALYAVEIFGGLMTIDQNLAIVGDLAEGWDVSPDGTTTTFRLRPEATFHNGRPVTATDIKWSLERAANPITESFNAAVFLSDIVGVDDKLTGLANNISGVQIINDHTITITTDAPKAYFLSKLTYPVSFVLDRENVAIGPSWILEPNGTGPFKMTEYRPGEVLRLTRFDDYHLEPAKLDEVEFLLSGGNSMLMYENDEIHVTGIGLSSLQGVQDPSNPLSSEVVTAPPQFDVDYFGLNTTEPPFDDIKVRQAFNYAIDRQTLATTLLQDLVVPAAGILPPGFPGYNPDLVGYNYDPDKARQLIQESKYGDTGELPRITLTVPGSFGAAISPSIEAMLAMWEGNLGVEISILQTEWAIFLQDLHQNRFQMFGGLGWIADYPDPENFLDVLFHSESTNNQSEYTNRQLDRLLELARVEQDEAVRFDLYHQSEEIIVDDAPWIPLWHSNGGYLLVKPEVSDYFLFPLIIPKYRYIYFTE